MFSLSECKNVWMQNNVWKRVTGDKGESAENAFHSGKAELY